MAPVAGRPAARLAGHRPRPPRDGSQRAAGYGPHAHPAGGRPRTAHRRPRCDRPGRHRGARLGRHHLHRLGRRPPRPAARDRADQHRGAPARAGQGPGAHPGRARPRRGRHRLRPHPALRPRDHQPRPGPGRRRPSATPMPSPTPTPAGGPRSASSWPTSRSRPTTPPGRPWTTSPSGCAPSTCRRCCCGGPGTRCSARRTCAICRTGCRGRTPTATRMPRTCCPRTPPGTWPRSVSSSVRWRTPRSDTDSGPDPVSDPVWARLTARSEDDSPAVVEVDGSSTSWRELHRRVTAVAGGLVAAGVRPGDRVALLVPPSTDLTVSAYAAWRAGATIVVADRGLGVRAMGRALRSARVDHVVGSPQGLAAARLMRLPGTRFSTRHLPGGPRHLDALAAGEQGRTTRGRRRPARRGALHLRLHRAGQGRAVPAPAGQRPGRPGPQALPTDPRGPAGGGVRPVLDPRPGSGDRLHGARRRRHDPGQPDRAPAGRCRRADRRDRGLRRPRRPAPCGGDDGATCRPPGGSRWARSGW